MSIAPLEILAHCLRCRRETSHWRAGQLSSQTLYACGENCGCHPRVFSDLQNRTPEARRLAVAAAEGEQRRWSKESRQPWPIVRTVEDVDHRPIIVRQVSSTQANRLKENNAMSALTEAITAEVRTHLREYAKREDLDKLETAIKDAASSKDLERQIERVLEDKLPDLVNQALLQMLAKPKAATTKKGADADDEDEAPNKGSKPNCPRHPHGGPCPGAWCKKQGFNG
jgi:hypothetical protein